MYLLILLTCFKQSATGTALADDNWPALHEVKVAEVSSLSVCVCIVREWESEEVSERDA